MAYGTGPGIPPTHDDELRRAEHRALYGGVGQVAKIVGVTTSIAVVVVLGVLIVLALV